MANATTARALSGLINDLDDERLRALTDSQNRPALIEFLDAIATKCQAAVVIAVWLTLKLGTRKDAAAYIEAVEASGAKVSDWARDIMSKEAFKVSPEVREVKFARATLRQLGLKKQSTLTQIIARAKERGLLKCLPEDGPLVRENYCDQPSGEYLWMAMDPIVDSHDDPRVFHIGCYDDERWLNTLIVDPDGTFGLVDGFVFRIE